VWLAGIVPGNRSKEPNNLNPYLSILVDELLAITNKKVLDAYQDAPFTLKVNVLLYVLDYPGISKVFKIKGANAYQGCAWCELEGTSYVHICIQNYDYVASYSCVYSYMHVSVHMQNYNIYICTFTYIGTYPTELHKMVYLQNRRYLLDTDKLRKDKTHFPDKEESHQAPVMRSYEGLKEAHQAYEIMKVRYVTACVHT